MKKIISSSLFSAVLVLGGGSITVFADDLGPTDPATPPITEPIDSNKPANPTELVDPAEPSVMPIDPIELSKLTEPAAPSKPEKPTEPTTPIDSETPVEPTEPSELTEPSQPTESTAPGEPRKPVTPEPPKEPTQLMIPGKPAEPETPEIPEQFTKPIDVVVTPSGEIDKTNQSVGTRSDTPTGTSNLVKVTHVLSETTPITTEVGEEIAVVDKGVPLTKTPEGLKPTNNSYKVLPSGNAEVKVSDGKMKTLPHTREKFTLLFSVLGSFFVLISGFSLFKKNKKRV